MAGDSVRDVVIGMSDGLTVPFALAAGISGAIQSTHVVVAAGLAEVAAGSIAMGLGGFLAARGDAEHYANELRREREEVVTRADDEKQEVRDVLVTYGLTLDQAEPIVDALAAAPDKWVDFMMRFELGLEEPDPRRAVRSAATIAVSYVAGGLIPLFPYFVLPKIDQALQLSVAVTLVALAVFGFVKSIFTGTNRVRGAVQTVVVGGVAAAAAFALARAVGGA
ncbi:MAG: VIT1/CCC1 transporter family protein [Fimbriimonadaceae bacterium]